MPSSCEAVGIALPAHACAASPRGSEPEGSPDSRLFFQVSATQSSSALILWFVFLVMNPHSEADTMIWLISGTDSPLTQEISRGFIAVCQELRIQIQFVLKIA